MSSLKIFLFVLPFILLFLRMAVYSSVISVLFLGKVFFIPSPATGVIIIVFFVAGLFSQVLAFVFRDAINYKEENDLTI